VTAAEVEEAARSALGQVDPALGALAAPPFEEALDYERAGPLAGVPFLIKDSGPFARGIAFAIGSRAVHGAVATVDHPLMARFRAAGLAALGRSAVPELCLNFATESVLGGVTHNPWSPGRGAGGSSGGAAALVAAGAVPIAHGNDGAGSLRIPAASCGLVGLKPSRGRTPDAPSALPAGHPVGVEFALTRTVRDAAFLLDTVASPVDGRLPSFAAATATNPQRLRVAVMTAAWSGVPVDAQLALAASEVGSELEWIGHSVEAAGPTIDPDDIVESEMLGIVGAGRAMLQAPRRPASALLEAVSRTVVRETEAFGDDAFAASVAAQARLTRRVDAFFAHHDLLVTPTLAQQPPPHGTLDYDDERYSARGWLRRIFEHGPFTAVFNATGHPAMSLPLGESREGLPIGVQLVAAAGREDLLFAVAAQLEQAMPWSGRRPSIFVD
jgi:amidase